MGILNAKDFYTCGAHAVDEALAGHFGARPMRAPGSDGWQCAAWSPSSSKVLSGQPGPDFGCRDAGHREIDQAGAASRRLVQAGLEIAQHESLSGRELGDACRWRGTRRLSCRLQQNLITRIKHVSGSITIQAGKIERQAMHTAA